MRRHLAIFSLQVAQEIIAGRKTVETRFSLKRISPFGEISSGDIVYIKPPGKPILGQFLVKKVILFENLNKDDWDLIKNYYGEKLSLGSIEVDQKYFKEKAEAKYGTVIFIDQVEQFITEPITYKKNDKRAWVVLD